MNLIIEIEDVEDPEFLKVAIRNTLETGNFGSYRIIENE